MRRLLYLAALLVPWAVQAGSGTWSADSNGRILSLAGQVSRQPLLAPPAGQVPQDAAITGVVWQIELLSPPPVGLHMQLCGMQRCIMLDGLSGRSDGLNGMSAGIPLTLSLWVPGGGSIYPPINVVSQQVIVNYR